MFVTMSGQGLLALGKGDYIFVPKAHRIAKQSRGTASCRVRTHRKIGVPSANHAIALEAKTKHLMSTELQHKLPTKLNPRSYQSHRFSAKIVLCPRASTFLLFWKFYLPSYILEVLLTICCL